MNNSYKSYKTEGFWIIAMLFVAVLAWDKGGIGLAAVLTVPALWPVGVLIDRPQKFTYGNYIDRVSGFIVGVTEEVLHKGGPNSVLNLVTEVLVKDDIAELGGVSKEFRITAGEFTYIPADSITMKIEGGGSWHIPSACFESEFSVLGYQKLSSLPQEADEESEFDRAVRSFGEMLGEAQKDGPVKYFIRIEGQKVFSDFEYKLSKLYKKGKVPVFFL